MLAPLGEARSNTAVFRALAQRLGFAAAALYESDDAIAATAFRTVISALSGRGGARIDFVDVDRRR